MFNLHVPKHSELLCENHVSSLNLLGSNRRMGDWLSKLLRHCLGNQPSSKWLGKGKNGGASSNWCHLRAVQQPDGNGRPYHLQLPSGGVPMATGGCHAGWARKGQQPPLPGTMPRAILEQHGSIFLFLCCWNIWKHRNRIVFDGIESSLQLLMRNCREDACVWAWRLPRADVAIVDV